VPNGCLDTPDRHDERHTGEHDRALAARRSPEARIARRGTMSAVLWLPLGRGLDLCSAALDRLGIAHRFPRPDTISVARRDAVAALDAAVGPKA
jgi:hypothetical protein